MEKPANYNRKKCKMRRLWLLNDSVFMIFRKKNRRGCHFFSFVLQFKFLLLLLLVCWRWSKRRERERTRKRRWCCKCWIPLWTASFLAERFQWATARSWNLANETHTPPPPPPTHPPRGLNVTLLAENLSGGKWLADQVLREQLSERVTSQTHSIHIQCGTR